MVRYGILHDHTGKKRKTESTPLYTTFKLKYRKNVKLKARIYCETFLSGYLMKYSFRVIS